MKKSVKKLEKIKPKSDSKLKTNKKSVESSKINLSSIAQEIRNDALKQSVQKISGIFLNRFNQ